MMTAVPKHKPKEKTVNSTDRKTLREMREDEAQAREDMLAELREHARREWAQTHGNDSGYDPYWNIQD